MSLAPSPYLSIVIPAYNEASRLPKTLQEILAYQRRQPFTLEVVVVDDGSSDATAQVVSGFEGVQVLSLRSNQGKGGAVRAGVLAARGALILFMDADGATPVEEFDRLHPYLTKGADIAIGSRVIRTNDSTLVTKVHRRAMGYVFRTLVQQLCVSTIQDTQCGFKLFTAAAATFLFSRLTSSRFAFDVEILRLAQLAGMKISEVPVSWHHVDGSRISLLGDSMKMAREVWRLRTLPQGQLREEWDVMKRETATR